MVLCAAGGDFLIEALPKLNLENIKNNEKWFSNSLETFQSGFNKGIY